MKFGISTMIYLGLTPSRALERILLKGIKVLELSYDNFLYSGIDELVELNNVVDVVSMYPMDSFSVHLPYDRLEISGSDVSKITSRFSKWIRILSAVNVDYYVVHLPRLSSSKSSVQLASAYLRTLAELLSGIQYILVENIADVAFLGSRPEDLSEIVYLAGSPRVGICLDVGHANIAKVSLRKFSDQLAPLIRSTHLHDNDGRVDQHLVPGSGTVDRAELIEVLMKSKPRLVISEVSCRGTTRCDSVLTQTRRFEDELRKVLLR